LLIQERRSRRIQDSLWVLFMVAALHALTMKRPVRLAICCGLALATKFFAVIIVPFLLARVSVESIACSPYWSQSRRIFRFGCKAAPAISRALREWRAIGNSMRRFTRGSRVGWGHGWRKSSR
jgi:hypothetical protein